MPQKLPSQMPCIIRENCQSNQAVWLNNAPSEGSLPSDSLVLWVLKYPTKSHTKSCRMHSGISNLFTDEMFLHQLISTDYHFGVFSSYLLMCKKQRSKFTECLQYLVCCISVEKHASYSLTSQSRHWMCRNSSEYGLSTI